jgi:hypothetical protein
VIAKGAQMSSKQEFLKDIEQLYDKIDAETQVENDNTTILELVQAFKASCGLSYNMTMVLIHMMNYGKSDERVTEPLHAAIWHLYRELSNENADKLEEEFYDRREVDTEGDKEARRLTQTIRCCRRKKDT